MTKLYEYVAIFSKLDSKEQVEVEALERVFAKKDIRTWEGTLKTVVTNLGSTSVKDMNLYSVVIYGL